MPGWTRVEEIIAYQLSVKLRDQIHEIANRPPIADDYKFKGQIIGAAASVPANIAEGFDRYQHGQFGYQVGVAKGSLAELKNHIEDARKRGDIDEDVCKRLLALLKEAKNTTNGLLRHLKTTEAPQPWSDIADTKEKSKGPAGEKT